ncbi:MAG TPA: chemotaxis protein CheW [Anaeromyxobacter sp.]|nr:chemotaxis protein CheW [Anaeromyxobacter sp.]
MESSDARTKPQQEAGARRPAPDPDPASDDVAALDGELAARLQALPVAGDGRFTTWRPGAGAPPVAAAQPTPGSPPRTGGDGAGPADAHPPAAAAPARRALRPTDPLDEFLYREDEQAPEVPAIGATPEAPTGDADPAIREEYLTFLLGHEEYAVAIERVREVIRAPPVTEVPHAPPHVLGVVTVRGEVVAVFDPRRRLSLPGAAPGPGQGRVVIVDAGEGPCGLLVDAVASVVRLRPGSIEPCPQGIGGASAECLAGIGRHADRLFTVLDLGAFLRRGAAAPRRGEDEDRHVGA